MPLLARSEGLPMLPSDRNAWACNPPSKYTLLTLVYSMIQAQPWIVARRNWETTVRPLKGVARQIKTRERFASSKRDPGRNRQPFRALDVTIGANKAIERERRRCHQMRKPWQTYW